MPRATSVGTTEAAIKDLGSTADVELTKVETGIVAADQRLKDLASTSKNAGAEVSKSLIDAGNSTDVLGDRVSSVTGTIGQLFGELGVDVTQFVRNAETVFNRFGGTFSPPSFKA